MVLGCSVHEHQPRGALLRRLIQAREVSRARPELSIIVSGGKTWQGTSESRAMANWWQEEGTAAPVTTEDHSHTTWENALWVARLCQQEHYQTVHLVTCDFHMRRAASLFARRGLTVITHPAPSPQKGWLRFRKHLREWGASTLSPLERWLK